MPVEDDSDLAYNTYSMNNVHSKKYRFYKKNLSVLLSCNPRRTLAGFSWGCMIIVLKGSF